MFGGGFISRPVSPHSQLEFFLVASFGHCKFRLDPFFKIVVGVLSFIKEEIEFTI
jgi:hypothetical protein